MCVTGAKNFLMQHCANSGRPNSADITATCAPRSAGHATALQFLLFLRWQLRIAKRTAQTPEGRRRQWQTASPWRDPRDNENRKHGDAHHLSSQFFSNGTLKFLLPRPVYPYPCRGFVLPTDVTLRSTDASIAPMGRGAQASDHASRSVRLLTRGVRMMRYFYRIFTFDDTVLQERDGDALHSESGRSLP
jgi:hypothetical protein